MKYDELISSFLDIGETMLQNGAEVSRVEDTIVRLCKAYGFHTVDIHAINSNIMITARPEKELILTQTRRISQIGTDLSIVEDCNALSREVCHNLPEPEYISKKLRSIAKQELYPWWLIWIGYIVAASAFAVFFGGNAWDALIAGVIATLIYFVQKELHRIHVNRIVENILLSAMLTAVAFAAGALLPGVSVDMVIIGNIMLLIPGLAFCNGIRDMVIGDTISGLLTMSDAILRALSIGLGYFLIMSVVRFFL